MTCNENREMTKERYLYTLAPVWVPLCLCVSSLPSRLSVQSCELVTFHLNIVVWWLLLTTVTKPHCTLTYMSCKCLQKAEIALCYELLDHFRSRASTLGLTTMKSMVKAKMWTRMKEARGSWSETYEKMSWMSLKEIVSEYFVVNL